MLSEGKEFHSAIKEARIKRGLTQTQLSEEIGVPFRSIQNWETGIRKCPAYVEKMVVDMIYQYDNRYFLQDLLEVLNDDLEKVQSEETKGYIKKLISMVAEQVNE